MDIQSKVKAVIAKQLARLGAETITVNGKNIDAIPAEIDSRRELMGGNREERQILYQFPTDSKMKLRTGMQCKAQGKDWKIDSVEKGKAMTTLTLIEPNRVEE